MLLSTSATELLCTNLKWLYHSQSVFYYVRRIFQTSQNVGGSFFLRSLLFGFSSWLNTKQKKKKASINKQDKINEQIKNPDNFCYLVSGTNLETQPTQGKKCASNEMWWKLKENVKYHFEWENKRSGIAQNFGVNKCKSKFVLLRTFEIINLFPCGFWIIWHNLGTVNQLPIRHGKSDFLI